MKSPSWQPLPGLEPNWFSMPYFSIIVSSRLVTILLITFSKMLFRHIGLQLFGLDRSPFFGRHKRTASCSCFASISLRQNLMMASFASSDSAFSASAGMPDSRSLSPVGASQKMLPIRLFLTVLRLASDTLFQFVG